MSSNLQATSNEIDVTITKDSMHCVLSRPERRNALSLTLVEAVIDALDDACARKVNSFVIEARGSVFCSGLDLTNIDSKSDGDLLLQLVRIETLLQKLYRAPFATLAFAQGAAFGAGADILAVCRERVGTENLKISFPGIRFGIFLGTRRLAGRIGVAATERVLTSHKPITGKEAHALGLLTEIGSQESWPVRRAELIATAGALDPHIAERIGRVINPNSDAEDMAELVHSASRPGLKDRIKAYVDSLKRS